ncbi:hypothetical protein ACTHGU_01085 [Chitinophagaceae bacterium MMS25-I14]
MKKTAYIFLALLLAGNLFSCKHDDDNVACIAGSGGTAEIVVYAVHNGAGLINYASHPDTAFVKYNTLSSPGTDPALYDTYFVSEASEDHVHCEHLKCGNYFIYRTAWDSVSNMRYTGGAGVVVGSNVPEVDTAITVN